MMMLTHRTTPPLLQTQKRRGVLGAWAIWTIPAAAMIAAGLFNLIWLSAIRSQARNCAEAAAISAGHSYLSDDMLRSWQQPFEYEGRATRCRKAAIDLVEQHREGTSLPPVLEEQVVVEWPESEGPASDPAMFVPKGISVSIGNPYSDEDRRSFFAGLTGVGSLSWGIRSGVLLEHAPVAFRPYKNAGIPMLPFAIQDEALPSAGSASEGNASGTSSGYWTSCIESGPGKDQFSWNPEARMFELGPDGIPEISVTISSDSSEQGQDAFIPLAFDRRDSSASPWDDWIRDGLTTKNMEAFGKTEIRFPGQIPGILPEESELSAIAAALQRKQGVASIVCLSALNPEGVVSSQISIKRPVAVRVVRAALSASGSIRVTLQPCILVTSTAITAERPDVATNRYIYSVRLSD